MITLNAEQTKKIRLPLDPIASVYLLEALDVGTGRLEARRELGGAVSHFSTCTKLREARRKLGPKKLTPEQAHALHEQALREMGDERGLLD